jgi:hypothetical protein
MEKPARAGFFVGDRSKMPPCAEESDLGRDFTHGGTTAATRAGPSPTRDKVLRALNNMGQLDLGGIYVDYSPKGREGWGGVDLTIIGPSGKLLR